MHDNVLKFVEHMKKDYKADSVVFSKAELEEHADDFGLRFIDKKNLYKVALRVKRGYYDISTISNVMPASASKPVLVVNNEPDPVVPAPAAAPAVNSSTLTAKMYNEVFIPKKSTEYVKWGHAKDIEEIIRSNMFFPTYVAGLSGNGKTMMIEQACARLKREYVRVQMTPETDEDDLIGGFRLIDGNTVFVEGPVIKAMRAGAILLVDEIDRASNRLMALQGVLEGNPVLIKKTHEVVTPAPGFNVIATANTYGQGCMTGQYSAATIIDEALLERFSVVFEQGDPNLATEKKILANRITAHCNRDVNENEKEMVHGLVKWAETVRKSFAENAIEGTISTRRLCHITNTFLIFGSVEKAIELCTNRFEENVRIALIDLYTKITGLIEAERAEREWAAEREAEREAASAASIMAAHNDSDEAPNTRFESPFKAASLKEDDNAQVWNKDGSYEGHYDTLVTDDNRAFSPGQVVTTADGKFYTVVDESGEIMEITDGEAAKTLL